MSLNLKEIIFINQDNVFQNHQTLGEALTISILKKL